MLDLEISLCEADKTRLTFVTSDASGCPGFQIVLVSSRPLPLFDHLFYPLQNFHFHHLSMV